MMFSRAVLVLVVVVCCAMFVVEAKSPTPISGSGSYKQGDAYSKASDVLSVILQWTACPRKDGSRDGLQFQDQCPPLPKNPADLPDLAGPETIWHWACFASLLNQCDNDGAPVGFDNIGHAFFTNWMLTDEFKDGAAHAHAEFQKWTEDQVLTDAKALLEALPDEDKAFVILLLQQALVASYIQASTINAFLWAPTPSKWSTVDIKKQFWVDALISALQAKQRSVPTTALYRGRTRRGTEDEQKAIFTVGNTVWEKAFASTTDDELMALGYSDEDTNAELVKITPAATNSRGAILGAKTGENLFEPGTAFKVTKYECHQNYKHEFKTNSFGGVGQKKGNTLCVNGKCEATWNNLCIIELQEEDTTGPLCPSGTTYLKHCVDPKKTGGKFEAFKQTILKKFYTPSTLGLCAYLDDKFKAKATAQKEETCQVSVLCRDGEGVITDHTSILNDGFCKPKSAPAGLYFN